MKKIIAATLAIMLLLSLSSAFALADDESASINWDKVKEIANYLFENNSDEEVQLIFLASLIELADRGVCSGKQVEAVIKVLSNTDDSTPSQKEYSFGEGTFVVGLDLQAGTYDITCESTDDSSYSDSFGALGDVYSGLGLDDYASMFNSMGGIADSLDCMYVEIINSKGYTEKYIDLKAGETARIVLEDGMKIELSGGKAKLTFIR